MHKMGACMVLVQQIGVVVLQTTTAGRRHLMQVGNGQPGVEVSLAIPTTAALAPQQTASISNAVNTGTLSSEWGQLGTRRYPA